MPAPGSLHRILGVRDGLAVTVGIVIGVGILRTPGLIAGYLGQPWLILAMWAAGGIVAGLSTLVLAEMAAALPHAGGKFVYAREAWGPLMGFVAGWSELLVTRGFSGAAKAVVIAEYIRMLVGRGSVPILAGAVVLAFFALHTRGLRTSIGFQRLTTVIKTLVIVLIAGAGIWARHTTRVQSGAGSTAPAAGLLGFALAYQAVAFAYYGWDDAAKLAEEVRDPGRALPRMLIGGAVAVAVLYLLMNISLLAAFTPIQMAGSPAVAQDVVAAVFGHAAGTVVIVASLVIMISSLNVNFLGLPRVAYGLAQSGLAARRLAAVDAGGTPRTALVYITAWIGLLALTGAFEFLINVMMMVAIAIDTMVLLGYFRLRAIRPALARPFQTPGTPAVPALTVVLYLAILAVMIGTEPRLALGGGTMIAVLVAAGLVVTRGARRRRPG
jgi:basic amino acid/polyamine antiporter, APA family